MCHSRRKALRSSLSSWSTKVRLLDEHDSHSTHFISPLLRDSNRFSRSDHKESRRFTCTQTYTVDWPTSPRLDIYQNNFPLWSVFRQDKYTKSNIKKSWSISLFLLVFPLLCLDRRYTVFEIILVHFIRYILSTVYVQRNISLSYIWLGCMQLWPLSTTGNTCSCPMEGAFRLFDRVSGPIFVQPVSLVSPPEETVFKGFFFETIPLSFDLHLCD